MKSIGFLITATTLLLAGSAALAQPSRAELLARGHDRHPGHGEYYRHAEHRYDHAYRDYRYAEARRYAAIAVRQARRARNLGYYPDHPRWSLNYQRHFRWALSVDRHRLERETRRRRHKLHELGRHYKHRYGHGGYRD